LRLPRGISWDEAAKAFEKAGWQRLRIRGSHLHMGKPGEPTILSIPLHDELALGTLRSLLRKARLSVDEFLRLLKDP